jgi:TP901 family phage tail tape measure protein
MADVNANIGINIDSSNALAQLKALQRQISQFHTSIARSSEAAALAQKGLQKNLLNSINSIGAFSAEMRTVKTSAESFTNSLEKNKFSMREYFRYAGGATKTFGRLFKSEFDTIGKVAEERVKRLQTQYIKMGRDTNGAMKAMGIMPTQLDMSDYTTKVQVAAQKQALFNQLMKQGSTNLLNFGKNTQWAGRQLMVGFTLPLMLVGSAATKTFMEMEAQTLRFKKVYGDLFTPQEETQAALDNITELGKQFTKYGVAVSQTVGLAAEAAAAGFQGLDLQRQTAQATRLSILGQVESQKALETTISLQNAFGMSSDKLAESIDFLNAVENQTVVSLDDITTAIPKVAPVIQQLGGDVKDLTFFMAAMKEGGINASEGANALKSGLAALINPTGKASDMLAQFGINAREIVVKNKGDLKATVIEFATALNQLDPLNRAQAIEQMFGKFQFARLSTLFANVAKDGNQAARVLDLANSSVAELSALSEKELGMTADSSMNKFKKSVEDLKIALVPVGKAFLEAATPIVEFVGNILEKFANLSSGTKKLITLLTVGIGAVGPVLLMTFGLLANGVANIIKLFLTLRGGYQRLTGQSRILGEQTQYMTMEQLDAAAAAHSLNQTHANLTQTFTAEVAQVNRLIAAYTSAAAAARNFSMNNPGMMMPGRGARKLASGIVSVPGPKGAGDIVPAMLSPGEAVIPAEFVEKYGPLINGMVEGNLPGYRKGKGAGTDVDVPGGFAAAHFGGTTQKSGAELLSIVEGLDTAFANQIRKMVSEVENGLDRLFTTFNNEVIATSTELNRAVGKQGSGYTAPIGLAKRDLVDRGEVRDIELQRQLTSAGTSVEEFKLINKKITDEIKIGFDELGDITTVTAEDLDKLVNDAYNKVAETDQRVKDAQTKMRKTSVVTDPRNDSRIAAGKDPYTKFRKGGKYFGGMEQVAGSSGVPYEKNARFRITKKMAESLGQSSEEAAVVYNKFSDETKRRLAGLRKDLKAFTAEFTAEAAKVGSKVGTAAVNATATAAGSASPSKKTKKIGEDIGIGLEQGMQSRQDDVARAGTTLGNAAVGGVKGAVPPVTFQSAGQPAVVARNAPKVGVPISDLNSAYKENEMRDAVRKQQQITSITNQRMNSLNTALMGGTFALSALSGVASMAGGTMGNLSSQVMKYSTLLFALMSITQLLTQTKVVELARTRGLNAGLLVQDITTRKAGLNTSLFSGGIKQLLPKLLNFGKIIARFLGPVGLVISGLLAAKGAFDLFNKAKEKERMATEGLADAMTMTTDKVKFLAGLLGQTPTARAGSGARISANQLNATEQTAVDELRGSKEFLDKYKKDIEAIKTGTVKEAELAFNAIALNLGGQGFTESAVKTYIDALGEEAGKTEVALKFKKIDLTTEEGQATALKLAKETAANLNKAFESGIKKTRSVTGGKGGFIVGPERLALTKEQTKALNDESAYLAATMTNLTSAFGNQKIKADEYNKQMAILTATIPKGTAGLLVMDKILLNVAPQFAEAAKGVKDYDTKLLLVRASLVNASVAQNIFDDLMSGVPEKVDAAKAKLEEYRIATDKVANQIIPTTPYVDPADSGTPKKSPFQLAKEDLIAQQKELKNSRVAYGKLRAAGISANEAFELSKNSTLSAALATSKKSSEVRKLLGLVKELKIEEGKAPLSPEEMFDVLEKSIEIKYRSAIKAGEAAVETAQKAVNGIEKEISTIQNSIEKKQRSIELTFNRPIETLQAESSILSEQLKDIDTQTTLINDKYDAQEKALTKISQINEDLIAQEKSKLTIADALSQGDISAAAVAVQEARATAAQASMKRSTDALQAGREFAIEGVTSATGLTKDQIAQKQLEIEKQISALEKQRSTATAAIRLQEDQIYTIQQGKLLTAQNAIITAEEALTKTRDQLTADLAVVTQQKQFYEYEKVAEDARRFKLELYTKEVNRSKKEAEGVLKTILDLERTVVTQHIINTVTVGSGSSSSNSSSSGTSKSTSESTGTKTAAAQKIVTATEAARILAVAGKLPSRTTGGKMYGGIISKYMAFGGRAMGSDTVPAMLTPGEFVMNKAASKSYGPLLERLNESKYPGMLGGGGMTQIPVNNISTSMNDNSTAVYNYNLGFSINGANGSAKDIANAVMREIKNVDSQRIRGQRR